MIILRTAQGRGIFAAALLFLLGACSRQQVYESAQGWRQSECGRIVDPAKSEACLRAANKSWPDYKQDKKAAE